MTFWRAAADARLVGGGRPRHRARRGSTRPAAAGRPTGHGVFFLATMALALGDGLWVWAWRPQTHMGPLMFWWPALASPATWSSRTRTRARLDGRARALHDRADRLAQMALSYPNGKLQGRLALWSTSSSLGYAAQVIQNAYNLLFYDARGCPYCFPAERSWLYARDAADRRSTGGTAAGRSRSSPSCRSGSRSSG